MKRLQFHSLITVCLATIIVLVVFVVPLTDAEVASNTPPHFNQPSIKIVNSNSASASLNKRPTPETDLPKTSNQSTINPINKLTARPYFANKEILADFDNFVSEVSNGQKDVIRGVYVPGIFALPIIQQQKRNSIFVSNKHNRVTQFQNAARNGIIGLLAHNYLAGSLFYELSPGHEVQIVYGDGAIQRYRIISTHRYQKLEPSNLRSNFIELSTGQEFSTAEVFQRFYQGEHRVTFQTCLERNGELNWGLLFIVADPLEA